VTVVTGKEVLYESIVVDWLDFGGYALIGSTFSVKEGKSSTDNGKGEGGIGLRKKKKV
jgi:hypothetical protein